MGSLLQVRDVPEDTRSALKARAATAGKSLNSYLLDVLTREVERPTVAEVLDRAARRMRQSAVSSLGEVHAGRAERARNHTPR